MPRVIVMIVVLAVVVGLVASASSTSSEKFPSFYDDLIPFESDLDCGEATSLLQRTIQLELAIKSKKHQTLVGLNKNSIYTERLLSGDLSDDHTLNHLWFASCNHQNRAQALWYHLYRRTILEPLQPPLKEQFLIPEPAEYPALGPNEKTAIDPGNMLLFIGDAVYLDRPPNPASFPPESQRTDATRQLWRKHYCSSVRRQLVLNGMVDDHDFGLNNAHGEYSQKYRTKDLFLDFLDLPNPVELGASRQFSQLAAITCATALGCKKTTPANLQDSSDVQALLDATVDATCLAHAKETIKTIHDKTTTNRFKELSKQYSGPVLDACYLNYNAILRFDRDQKSLFSQARVFNAERPVFDASIDLSRHFELTNSGDKPDGGLDSLQQQQHDPEQLRRQFETRLVQEFALRRSRHGTSDVSVLGPLFRRVKTLLIDIRVTAVDYFRQMAESHWKWVTDQFALSIIPSIEQALWRTDRRGFNEKTPSHYPDNAIAISPFTIITQEEKRDFLGTLDQLRNDFSIYSKSGELTLDLERLRAFQDRESLKTKFQCTNKDLSSANYLKWLSDYPNFLSDSTDILTVSSGILIASWGKYFSEGWRTTPGCRTRMLELTARTMALSRQRVDEWKLFFNAREELCGDSIPFVTFRDDPTKHGGTDRFMSQTQALKVAQNDATPRFSKVPITTAMKPIAIVYLTGDIHFSEAARTYLPMDLSTAPPKIISDLSPDITIQSKFENLTQETMLFLFIDSIANGRAAQNNVELYSHLINQEVKKIVKGDWNLAEVIKEEQQYRATPTAPTTTRAKYRLPKTTLFDRYVAPISDITTSGITHAWGGYSKTSGMKEGAIKGLFRTVLRPSVTNIDYTTKHRWLVDDLEARYKVPASGEEQQNAFKVKLTADDFGQMKKQDRFFIYHNIGDIQVDWDHDIIHLMVRNVTLEPALRFSSTLEHHRAYTIPQLASFKSRSSALSSVLVGEEFNIDRINYSYGLVADEVQNHAKAQTTTTTATTDPKSLFTPLSKSPTHSIDLYLKDLQLQLAAESGSRFIRGFELTKGIMSLLFFIVLVILVGIGTGCRLCYTRFIRPLVCPARHRRIEHQRATKAEKIKLAAADAADSEPSKLAQLGQKLKSLTQSSSEPDIDDYSQYGMDPTNYSLQEDDEEDVVTTSAQVELQPIPDPSKHDQQPPKY